MSTTPYAIYDSTTGEIRLFMTSEPAEIAASTPTGCSYLAITAIPNTADWYVDLTSTPTFTAKTTLSSTWSTTTITANGVSSASISSLPNPTTIHFDSFPAAIDSIPDQVETSGSFALTTTYPGNYTVRLIAFPNADLTTTITAT